ncbi:MAG: hypothetical protein M1814_001892 [Vezdaea aestivalis]|nr:MAG: hypothetical protein M1814_001892 [Vezdaea aestivalis]
MLSRGNSLTSSRIRRTRSNASVGTYRQKQAGFEPTDRDAQHQQALAAASRAFENAQMRNSRDPLAKHFRSESKGTVQSDQPLGLSRKSSIRFSADNENNRRKTVRRSDGLGRNDSVLSRTTQASSISRAESYVDQSTHMNRYYTPMDDVASIPSSYRRVRKSNSMFNTRKVYQMRFRRVNSTLSQEDNYPRFSDASGPPNTLSGSKSTSFLRGNHSFATFTTSHHNDVAIQAARDQYLRDIDKQHRLRSRPSALWMTSSRRAKRVLRRTVRTSATTTYGNGVKSAHQGIGSPQKATLGHRARNISLSLTAKFRRMFLKPNEINGIPAQQLDASRDYSRPIPENGDTTDYSPERHSEDEATISCVQSRVPSLHLVAPYRKPKSKSGSFHSASSGHRSRVTSWTDSTAANTLATRQAALERKKLSIISEGADKLLGSNSTPQGYEVFNTPINSVNRRDQAVVPVDSRQLFTALRQKIDRREHSGDDVFAPPSTVKQGFVALSGQYPEPVRKSSSHDGSGSSALARPDSKFDEKLLHSAHKKEHSFSKNIQYPREAESAFFPHYVATNAKGTSPYRLALAANNGPAKGRPLSGHVSSDASNENLAQPSSVTGASSIYSRTTSGNLAEDDPSPSISDKVNGRGTATIITNRNAPNLRMTFPRMMRCSPRPSGEWSKWMTSQITDLESAEQNLNFGKSLMVYGHNREVAQMDPEDTQIGSPETPKVALLTATNGNISSRQIDSKISPVTHHSDRTPFQGSSCRGAVQAIHFGLSEPGTESISSTDLKTDVARGFESTYGVIEALSEGQVKRMNDRNVAERKINDFGPSIGLQRSRPLSKASVFAEDLGPNDARNNLHHNRSTATMKLRFARAGDLGAKVNDENERGESERPNVTRKKVGLAAACQACPDSSGSFDPNEFFSPQGLSIRIMILRLQLLLVAAWLVPTTRAVYTDEAYHTDFHHALVGIPQQHSTFFHQPSPDSKASLLYSLTEKGVLGALNPKDGALIWRQVLTIGQNESVAGPGEGCLRAGEGDTTIISGLGSQIRAWNSQDGKPVWNTEFYGIVRDLEVLELEDGKDHTGGKDLILLMSEDGKGIVRKLSGSDGRVLWEYTDYGNSDLPYEISASAESVFLISLQAASRSGLRIKVTSLNPVTGKQIGHYTLASDSDISSPEDIVFVGANSAAPIIAWTDKSVKTLKVNIIGSKHVTSLPIPNDKGEHIDTVILHAPHHIRSLQHFLVHFQSTSSHWAEVYHINPKSLAVTQAYSLPRVGGKGVFSASSQDANVFFVRITDSEVLLVTSDTHGILGRWPKARQDLQIDDEFSLSAVSEVVPRSGSSHAVRSAHVTSDGYWSLIRNGKNSWRRPELLSGVIASGWADQSSSQTLLQELDAEIDQNPVTAYVHRVKRHARDLQYFPGWLQGIPGRILGSFFGTTTAADSGSDGDGFGFRKVAIVATDNGHVLGLDFSQQGKILWDIKAVLLNSGETWNVKKILPSSKPGFVKVLYGEGSLAGRESDVAQEVEIGQDKFTTLVSLADEKFNDTSVPFMKVVPQSTTSLAGIQVSSSSANVLWQFTTSADEKIISITNRPAHDPTASIGRVMGDRSVKYKYLNPNLVAVAAINAASSSLTLTLLDAVSGRTLHAITHDSVDVRLPILTLLTGNTLVYSLSVHPSLGNPHPHRLHLAELFESPLRNDRGPLGASSNYSAFTSPSTPPSILTQSFILPFSISSLTSTQSLQGITTRSLLFTTPDIPNLFSLPFSQLSPLRPVGRDPDPAEQEEGLSRYSPELVINAAGMLGHVREVWIEQVAVLPANMESTCLVLGWGLDVFGTRVSPSGAFDVLGREFGKIALVGTVLALGVGVSVVAPLVRKKQIDGLWTVS